MEPVQTADKITDAAMALFAERGYAATTTRAIAEAAGVNEVTLFRTFGTKRGLLDAIGARYARLEMPELDDTDDLRGTLLRWARADVDAALQHGGFMLRMGFDAASVPEVADALKSEQGPAGAIDRLTDYFARAARAGTVRGDLEPAVLAEGFLAMTGSIVMYRRLMGVVDTDPLAAVEALVDVFCRGAESSAGTAQPTPAASTTTPATTTSTQGN